MTTVAFPPDETFELVDTVAEPVLAARDVRVSYGESFVVNGASITVQPGEVSCLMGRNGAGKTTLMKAIMGILPIRGGSISVFGQDVRRWP